MHESPRIRRLRNDLAALERLAAESSIFQFQATGNPPHHYSITFKGKGLCRDRGKIKLIQSHQVDIKLGASYPRNIPELRWLTPVYHPNISEIGMVCLGGYGTHWVPSVQLDELCQMLWDMARYHNYDIRSPYNRDAALWVANQTAILFPTDPRPLRDLRVAQGRITAAEGAGDGSDWGGEGSHSPGRVGRGPAVEAGSGSAVVTPLRRVRRFIEQYGQARAQVPDREPHAAPAVSALEPAALAPAGEIEVRDGASATPREETAAVILRRGAPVDPVAGPAMQVDEMYVLDERADPSPVPTRPAPGGEEIIFLE